MKNLKERQKDKDYIKRSIPSIYDNWKSNIDELTVLKYMVILNGIIIVGYSIFFIFI